MNVVGSRTSMIDKTIFNEKSFLGTHFSETTVWEMMTKQPCLDMNAQLKIQMCQFIEKCLLEYLNNNGEKQL